ELYLKLEESQGSVVFHIGDNGKGLPDGFVLDEVDSLGLQLVQALVEQLDGDLSIERRGGTLFKIAFPLIKVDQ
ncbi:MAG TPA: hypothetical protein VKY37_13595, partial [Brumimicrobium sp.]|nr:hypothetical protein [Brumimicrobium sp.]